MKNFIRLLSSAVIVGLANIWYLFNYTQHKWTLPCFVAIYIAINIFSFVKRKKLYSARLRICADGCELLIQFLISTFFTLIFQIAMAFVVIPKSFPDWLLGAGIAFLVEAVVFWNGIIRVYCTSIQLGIKTRVIGALLGWVPIANVCALYNIVRTVGKEVEFENNRIIINNQRKAQQICKTKYPVLLVHGVFFRDYKLLNYWGRVPRELEINGAEIFYGNHESASSVIDSANQLAKRIKEIIETTGCEKVNIIAHSKGGLDCRYAISKLGVAPMVATLTTVNTPHRGCLFVDYLLEKIPENMQKSLADTYNNSAKLLGDIKPDFMSAVRDLTESCCAEFNKNVLDSDLVYYQSIGSKLNNATNGKFPLNFSYPLVNRFSGDNDGLVAEPSFRWGSSYNYITVKGKRGVSHGDVIDLNRENIDDFDVREFYIQLVADLKNKGY